MDGSRVHCANLAFSTWSTSSTPSSYSCLEIAAEISQDYPPKSADFPLTGFSGPRNFKLKV